MQKLTVYLKNHSQTCQCNSCKGGKFGTCEVLELGTDRVVRTFRSKDTFTAENRADDFTAIKRHMVVDYKQKTRTVTGIVDVTLKDMLKNSEKTFPLYLAMRLSDKLKGRLRTIRCAINDIGISGTTIGLLVEAKLKKEKK